MNTIKQKNGLHNQKGMTLIEIIVSLAILGIILVPFMNMFVHSTLTTQKSGVILDASYEAQSVMEDIYNDSKDGIINIPSNGIDKKWDSVGHKYWIDIKISTQTINPVDVLIRIYSDESETNIEAQIETKLVLKQ